MFLISNMEEIKYSYSYSYSYILNGNVPLLETFVFIYYL